MKKRDDAVDFIATQFGSRDHDSRKGGCYHYGCIELGDLLDFIYNDVTAEEIAERRTEDPPENYPLKMGRWEKWS